MCKIYSFKGLFEKVLRFYPLILNAYWKHILCYTYLHSLEKEITQPIVQLTYNEFHWSWEEWVSHGCFLIDSIIHYWGGSRVFMSKTQTADWSVRHRRGACWCAIIQCPTLLLWIYALIMKCLLSKQHIYLCSLGQLEKWLNPPTLYALGVFHCYFTTHSVECYRFSVKKKLAGGTIYGVKNKGTFVTFPWQ